MAGNSPPGADQPRAPAASGWTGSLDALAHRVAASPSAIWLLLAAWFITFAPFRPLTNPDEGRYTDIARWMAQSGDWLVPRLNGLPFLHKPPLYYWIEGGVIKLAGSSLFSARVVSLLAGLVTCAAIYALIKRFEGRRVALYGVGLLATSPLFFGASQYANLDMAVTGVMTVTLALAALATVGEPAKARWLWPAAYLGAALGLLTKGLIGIAFPGAIWFIWMLATGRARQILSAISPIGIAVFAVVALPWFLVMERKFPGFNSYFFVFHQFERYVGNEFSDQQGVWFYPVILFLAQLPWSAAVLLQPRRVAAAHKSRDLLLLGVIWLVFELVFFSIPRSKLVGYIFPMLPAGALIAGPWLAALRWRREMIAGAMVLCVAFGIGGWIKLKRGPADLGRQLVGQIGADEELVFTNTYYFDIAVALNRPRPSLLVGAWKTKARELPDSLERQLMEGKEFEPATAARLLITEAQLAELLQSGKRVFVIVQSPEDSKPPYAGWPVVARDRGWTVVRVGGARAP